MLWTGGCEWQCARARDTATATAWGYRRPEGWWGRGAAPVLMNSDSRRYTTLVAERCDWRVWCTRAEDTQRPVCQLPCDLLSLNVHRPSAHPMAQPRSPRAAALAPHTPAAKPRAALGINTILAMCSTVATPRYPGRPSGRLTFIKHMMTEPPAAAAFASARGEAGDGVRTRRRWLAGALKHCWWYCKWHPRLGEHY